MFVHYKTCKTDLTNSNTNSSLKAKVHSITAGRHTLNQDMAFVFFLTTHLRHTGVVSISEVEYSIYNICSAKP